MDIEGFFCGWILLDVCVEMFYLFVWDILECCLVMMLILEVEGVFGMVLDVLFVVNLKFLEVVE